MDYSIEVINKDIFDLAKEIKEDVPYWMHRRPVIALKKALKRCRKLEEVAIDSSTVLENREIILGCLKMFDHIK